MKIYNYIMLSIGVFLGFLSGFLFSVWLTAKINTLPPNMPPPVHMTIGSPNGLTNLEYSCQPLQNNEKP